MAIHKSVLRYFKEKKNLEIKSTNMRIYVIQMV